MVLKFCLVPLNWPSSLLSPPQDLGQKRRAQGPGTSSHTQPASGSSSMVWRFCVLTRNSSNKSSDRNYKSRCNSCNRTRSCRHRASPPIMRADSFLSVPHRLDTRQISLSRCPLTLALARVLACARALALFLALSLARCRSLSHKRAHVARLWI